MKKYFLGMVSFFLVLLFVGCGTSKTPTPNEEESDNPIEEEEVVTMNIKISVNGYSLTATLLENDSAKAFYELVKDGLTLQLSEYGGFEKVGPIGKALPSHDTRIDTKPGDLILYASSQLSFMYGSNTWSYTKLGAIDHLDQINLASILGNGDVQVTFTI